MNFALPSPCTALAPRRLVQPLWTAALGWLMACAATVAVAGAGMPGTEWTGDPAAPAPVARLLPTMDVPVLKSRASGRCQSCGVVEIVRKLEATGVAPAAYELTVRLRDGSRRLSNQALNTGWRVGDSIMLIGGQRQPAV